MNPTNATAPNPADNDSQEPNSSHYSHPSHNSHVSHTSHLPSPPPDQAPKQPDSPDFPHFPLSFLKNSSRRDDRLAQLPPEDQAQIIHWFALDHTFCEVIELAAKPRPDGLNLKLSLGVLHRFYHKHNLAEKIADAAQLVADLCPETSADPNIAFQILAQTHALNTMGGPHLDHAAFQHITRFLLRQEEYRLRQRSLDLREKRLAYEMQHKHYDIFKRTVEQLPEINEIVRNQSLSPAEKFRQHCIKVFGKDAVEMIERANEKWAREHPDQKHTIPSYSEQDAIMPLTSEEQQAADKEAIDDMMGWQNPEAAPLD